MLHSIHTKDGFNLSGECGQLIENIQKNWLIGLNETNPALIAMFKDRDKTPYRDMLPWSGEFAGKYITGAYYVYQVTHDVKLYDYITDFIKKLLDCMDNDGYIGVYSKECKLTGAFSQNPCKSGETWDAWSHYHIMFGLYLWYKETGNKTLLDAAEKAAGLFIRTFYSSGKRLSDIGCTEMNLAPLHIFAILYLETKNKEYLNFACNIIDDIEGPGAGNYIRFSKEGYEYYQCPKPRWESLHVIMGILNMADCCGNKSYYESASQIFYSILKTDVHNTGGFSTNEQAVGNLYENKAIELCCVIAYNAFASELYIRNKDIRITDFLEQSYYNAILGSYSPTGRWSTYNTPMEGIRKANYQDCVFQSRAGSPDLNCCSANSGRGLGQLCTWAYLRDEAFYINFYESCRFETDDGIKVTITGDYPVDNRVTIETEASADLRFMLRIPEWSHNTTIKIKGAEVYPEKGQYYAFNGTARIEITFDFTPHFQQGGGAYSGKRSVFIGPVLYGVQHYDTLNDLNNIPSVTDEMLSGAEPKRMADGCISLALKGITLFDFSSLGRDGGEYRTWLPY